MVADFLKGVAYITSGCKAFYGDRKAWRYVVIPIFIVFLVYTIAFWGIIFLADRMATRINEMMSGLPGWLSWFYNLTTGVSYTLGGIVALILLGTTVCVLYEMFGGLCFDSLVSYYEQNKYGIVAPHFSFIEMMIYCLDSVFFGIRTTTCFILLFIISLFSLLSDR